MRAFLQFMLAVSIACYTVPASARNILIVNDDGLTSNLVALYHALKKAGHNVVVSVPCTNQSGAGAAIQIGRPLGQLDHSCLNGAAERGDPGAGQMTRADLPEEDFYYVDGTPVMALLYGMDIIAAARWGAMPDLVLSGPNEGQNVGAIILSSGTVSAAQFAALNGIPAIALSAGPNTRSETLDNPLSAEVARRSVELVAVLEKRAGNGRLLPHGIALNVNFPNNLDGAKWRASKIGSYNSYHVGFTKNLAASASPNMKAMAERAGARLQELPGVTLAMNDVPPNPEQAEDESVVHRKAIAVSPMQAGYDSGPVGQAFIRWQLADLLSVSPDDRR